jgi:predicted transcriptional regulator
MTTQVYTSALKALRDASEPLSTATLAQCLGVDEMAVHLRLRRLYGLGKITRQIQGTEAFWSYMEPPAVEFVEKPKKTLAIPKGTRVCLLCERPL